MARKSGIYNTKMAIAILSALSPESAFTDVPAMPVTHGTVAHQERGLLMAQLVLGMVMYGTHPTFETGTFQSPPG